MLLIQKSLISTCVLFDLKWEPLACKRIAFRVRCKALTYLIALLAILLWGCSSKVRSDLNVSNPASESELSSAAKNSQGAKDKLKKAWDGKGSLREFYLRGKYPQSEIEAVASMLELVFPDRPKEQKSQMLAEVLAFHYVVYHPTENHDLAGNHHTIGRYRALLEKICARHGVPFFPVLAITSWENSGGSSKVSWADAAGLGQMTWGAVDEAHRYASRKAASLKEQAQWERYQEKVDHDGSRLEKAKKLEAQAALLNIEQRHRQMAKKAGVADERAIAECNLEDVVLFFDFLLSSYGGRVDHAIGAYHKGVLNHDDILYDYVRRRDPTVLYPQPHDRSSFLEAVDKLNVCYVDLWNDPRSREMLNGLRTVEGEVTTSANAHLALGDESDIYPWKVLGSLSGLLAGDDYLNKAIQRYSAPQLVAEVNGLPTFLGEDGLKRGSNEGWLVKIPGDLWQGKDINERALWARAEMIGYLEQLHERLKRLGYKRAGLPIVGLGEVRPDSSDWEKEIAAKGVFVCFSVQGLSSEESKNFDNELKRDYLFDRIYLRSALSERRLVINPRFGHEFMKVYEAHAGVRRK